MINNKIKSSSKDSKNQNKPVTFNKVSKTPKYDNLPVPINLKAFSLSDLKTATKNFRPDSLLGEGGFGRVFKGWIDETTFAPVKPGTGLVVAVKILKAESRQGHREWLVSYPIPSISVLFIILPQTTFQKLNRNFFIFSICRRNLSIWGGFIIKI